MEVVIFAGGQGTRLTEYTKDIPKPLVCISDKPIIMHLIDIYATQGFKDFILCAGYKKEMLHSFFKKISIKMHDNKYMIESINNLVVSVQVCDTGEKTCTATRLKKVINYIHEDKFMLTYADGLANVSLEDLVSAHDSSNNIITLTAVEVVDNFGVIESNDGKNVTEFYEKSSKRLINGGFMLCDKRVIDYLPNDDLPFETSVLTKLAKDNKLGMYKHKGMWKCIDTLKDKLQLEEELHKNNIPWLQFN